MLIFDASLIAGLVLFALVLDAIVGDPDWIWRRLPHPVVWFGAIISRLDRILNSDDASDPVRKRNGILALGLLLCSVFCIGLGLHILLLSLGWVGWLLYGVIGSVFIAQKSMADHVVRVLAPLQTGDLVGARKAVSMIVGRQTDQLDEAAIARAAIESTAENYSDGSVAPAFWFLVLGLPGLLAYKALNTADSMIGHRNQCYEQFGWAAARLDDWANLIPARLAMLFILLAPIGGSISFSEAWRRITRDAIKHRSPNAGWPEGAMAVKLGVALSGPRIYDGVETEEPYLNAEGKRHIGWRDLQGGIRLFRYACLTMGLCVGLVWILS